MHGFTATPEEVRPLGDGLAARGFPCRAVRLPGHATDVADLARTGRAAWIESVDAAVGRLRTDAGRVAVAGVSMGALLAIVEAAARPHDVAALVLCATPLVLGDTRAAWVAFVGRLPGVSRRFALIRKTRPRDIADPEARARSQAYPVMPLAALREFMRLRVEARRALAAVTAPTLVLHGRLDHTAPVANVEYLRRRLRTAVVETRVFERSAHVLTEDLEREAVSAAVADFLDRRG